MAAVSSPIAAAGSDLRVNLAGIDLISIRLVVHCAEAGSLSAAARLGHMSLSCASHRLSTLEMHFKTKFFVRDHRGLKVTDSGAVFARYGQAILQALERLDDQLASIDLGQRSIEVIVPPSINTTLQEDLKKHEYPHSPMRTVH